MESVHGDEEKGSPYDLKDISKPQNINNRYICVLPAGEGRLDDAGGVNKVSRGRGGWV
jgi:hypothetical protein